MSVAIIISQFSQLGSPNMIIRYQPYFSNKILSISLVICAIGLFITLSTLLVFQDFIVSYYEEKSPLFKEYFMLVIPFGIAMVFTNIFDAYLRTFYKNWVSTLLSSVVLRLIWTALILFHYYDIISYHQFIFLFAYAYTSISLLSLLYIFYLGKFKLEFRFNNNETDLLKEIKSFSLFTLLSGLSAFLINKIDILMLGSYEGLEIVAVYAIASYMASVIVVPGSAIARTAQPLVANAFKSNNVDVIASIYKKSSNHQLLLSGAVYALIILNYSSLLHFLPPIYVDSFLIFFFLGLSRMVDTGLGINGIIIINSTHYKIDTLFSLGLLVVTIISNLVLIPHYGAVGAALATMLSLIIYNVAKYLFLKTTMNLSPFSIKSVLIMLILMVSFTIAYYIPSIDNVFLDVSIKSVSMLALFVPLTYFTKVSKELNELLKKLIQAKL